jgi:dihydrodipicolinate synthase/N-acetylneuraminate lyase
MEKKWAEAERLSKFYMPLCKALFLDTNPQCVKWAMKCLGLNNGILRLPLIEPSETAQAALKKVFVQLSIPFLSRKTAEVL